MGANTVLPPAEARDLASLVEYSADSVVSKTLIERKTGTLTLFAFDAGQGLSEHTAPFDALVQIVDGEAELTLGGKTLTASAGQAVLMPANVPHALQAVRRCKMLLTLIRS